MSATQRNAGFWPCLAAGLMCTLCRAQAQPDLRIAAGNDSGTLVIYPAAVPVSDAGAPMREAPGYVAYWNDAEVIFVYSELLFSLPDVKNALAALERDFRPGLLSELEDSADGAASTDPNRDRKGAARRDVRADRLGTWLVATPETIYRVMGFPEPPPDFDPNLIGDIQQACDQLSCEMAGLPVFLPPGATRWGVPDGLPPGTPFEQALVQLIQLVSCCRLYSDPHPRPPQPPGGGGPSEPPCPGCPCLNDVDCDGVPDGQDSDLDGDGNPNGSDDDDDGDGIPDLGDPTPGPCAEPCDCCGDGDPCTDDSCDQFNGCLHTPHCPPDQQCCNGTCCATSDQCCDGACCGPCEQCCNGACCGPGEVCCDDLCCQPGEECCDGVCCPGSSSVAAAAGGVSITASRINQDNPNNTVWTALGEGGAVYGGSEPSTADNLKLEIQPNGTVANVVWTWEGDGSATWNAPPTGPEALTWTLGDLRNPVPGVVTFTAQVEYASGAQECATFEAEIGVRTDDVIVVGWINPSGVPWPMPAPAWLTSILPLAGGPPVPAPASCNHLIYELTENDESPSAAPAALTAVERDYVLLWMFRFGGNVDPRVNPSIPGGDFRDSTDSFMDETEFSTFTPRTTDYKLINRLQIKYRSTGSAFQGTPIVLKRGTWIGHTTNPCGPFWPASAVFPGQRGLVDTGSAVIGASNRTITLINDGSPDAEAIRAFNTLRGKAVAPFGWTPVFWENIGSAIRFLFDGGTAPTVVLQPYPTYHEYRNGKWVGTTAQAASPLGNFFTNPYPFGTVSCTRLQGITPGGRCGDAISPAAPSAGVPNYILILP